MVSVRSAAAVVCAEHCNCGLCVECGSCGLCAECCCCGLCRAL